MTIVKGKITWIDVLNPTKSDIEYIKKQHDFHPIILDELLHFSARSKVEIYDSYIYLAYHLPIYDAKTRTSRRAEIDFLITHDAVITVHYEDLEPIDRFSKAVTDNAETRERSLAHSALMVYGLLQEVNAFCGRELRHIDQKVTAVTKDLFSHQEYQMLQRISYIKRDILDYDVIAKQESILLESLRDAGTKFFGDAYRIYLSDLHGDHLKVVQQLENYYGTIESCEETNAQLLNAKTNSVMQRFTILAFLTFPLMLFTSLFNVDLVTREINDPNVFWFGFGGVLVITTIVVLIFKKRGLLRD